jgi:hypothetical protein
MRESIGIACCFAHQGRVFSEWLPAVPRIRPPNPECVDHHLSRKAIGTIPTRFVRTYLGLYK